MARRFWLEFEIADEDFTNPERQWNPLLRRVGVTGWDLTDCLGMIRDWLYGGEALPPLSRVVEDVDVSTLMLHGWEWLGVPVWRGVWCPGWNRDLSGAWPSGPQTLRYRLIDDA